MIKGKDKNSFRPVKFGGQRSLRVGEVLKRALFDLMIRNEILDKNGKAIQATFTQVDVSKNLKSAKVYYIPFAGVNKDMVEDALKINLKRIKSIVATNVRLKSMPDLKFFFDDTMVRVEKVEQLIQKSLGDF